MSESSDLEKLFAARREIDRELLEKHAREVAVMFTDIVGSTSFFERKGDIEGLALVKRHNDALFPLVSAHGGRVVKTIGDAIMAVFETAPAAASCAAEMQKTLAAMNAAHPGEGEIHVRIGIHAGRALLDQGDLFGDTVNVAARVNHEARADEVLLSQAAASTLPKALATWPRGQMQFKGKSEPMPVVALNWGAGAPPPPAPPEETSQPPRVEGRREELFVLELGRGAEGLRVSVLDGDKDKGTVKAFADVPLQAAALDELARSFGTFMHAGPATYRDEVRALGERLFAEALPPRAQRKLAQSEVHFARIMLEDALVHVPWELLHDGREFLALRYAVGRTVATRSATSPGVKMPVHEVARALVVSNPSGDLPAAGREGKAVAGLLRDGAGLEVVHLEGPVTRAQFQEALRGAHWLHFAGHTAQPRDGKSAGFVLADAVVDAQALMDAVGAQAPAVVFANACRASGEQWLEAARGISSLASGLLMRGVQHYLGPMWELPDEDGLAFALRFYEHALAGVPLGEAVRRARQSLYASAATPNAFAGYVLYGDPRLALPAARARLAPQPVTRSTETSGPFAIPPRELARLSNASPGQGQPLPPQVPEPVVPRKRAQLAVAGAAIACAVLGGALVWSTRGSKPVEPQPVPAVKPAAADPARHTGPLRLAVLPFKNVSGERKLDYLKEAWPEALITDLAGQKTYQLIERGQLDLDLGELAFSQKEGVVDPATRAQLGKIQGAEVVVLGSFQKDGDTVRAQVRFVNAETGEVLEALKADRPASSLLELQDAVTSAMETRLQSVVKKMRP